MCLGKQEEMEMKNNKQAHKSIVNWLRKYNETFLEGQEQKELRHLINRVEWAGIRSLNEHEKELFVSLISEILDLGSS